MKETKSRIETELRLQDMTHYFSLATYYFDIITRPLIETNIRGKLIDIGCGDMPYKEIIVKKVSQYDTIDIEKRAPDVKYVGNVENMNMIKDNCYDSAICLEVLEHVPHPQVALAEIFRILNQVGA